MNIVVLGASTVGTALVEHLVKEGHDIIVIDSDVNLLKNLQSRFDIQTFAGHGSYPRVLRGAGVAQADMIIAVTDSDELNMVACMLAYLLFNTPIKIARVHSEHYALRNTALLNENLAIDLFISPEQEVIGYIKAIIDHPGAFKVISFAEGRVKLIGVKPFYGGNLFGKTLDKIQDVLPGVSFRIAAIFRNQQSIALTGSTTIEIEDEVYFIAPSEYVEMVLGALRPLDKPNQRILIAGGGNIGFGLASVLEYDYQVKVMDRRSEQCQFLSEVLERSTVLLGDATDKDLLVNENIEDMDVFCALTDNGEVNIIASVQAKQLGARKTIALMTKPAYRDLIQEKEISVTISPEEATVSSILMYVRGRDIIAAHALKEEAEVVEVIARGDENTSHTIGRKVCEINLPEGVSVSLIVRGDEVILPEDQTVIEVNDHMIVFVANKQYAAQLGALFGRKEL